MDEMIAYLGLFNDEEPVESLCVGCKRKERTFVKT
jgi:hypothetical protein